MFVALFAVLLHPFLWLCLFILPFAVVVRSLRRRRHAQARIRVRKEFEQNMERIEWHK
jgi:hypothetical protein